MEASLYEELWRTEQEHWWFVARREIVRTLVDRYAAVPADGRLRICELGCGTGGNLGSWVEQHEVVGVDASEHALRFARQRLGSRAHYGRLPNEIPLDQETFDVVLSLDVFEHIEDDLQSAETAISLLRPGGILVATVPAYQWLYSPRDAHHQHFRRYGKSQFRRLFNLPNVKEELLSFYNACLFPPAAVVRLLSKIFASNAEPGDLQIPPGPFNRLLAAVFAAERGLLGHVELPFGLSLITVARKLPAASHDQDRMVQDRPAA